jgi:hypothetical protein
MDHLASWSLYRIQKFGGSGIKGMVLIAFEEYIWTIAGLPDHTQWWYLGRQSRFVMWCEDRPLTMGMLRPMYVAIYVKELREQVSPQIGGGFSPHICSMGMADVCAHFCTGV